MYILKPKFVLISINLYNLHLYLLKHLLYVLYSASIRHARISAIDKQYYHYYYSSFIYLHTHRKSSNTMEEVGRRRNVLVDQRLLFHVNVRLPTSVYNLRRKRDVMTSQTSTLVTVGGVWGGCTWKTAFKCRRQ